MRTSPDRSVGDPGPADVGLPELERRAGWGATSPIPDKTVWQWIASESLAVLVVVARTWLSIRVELVSGRGEQYWPRPGRVFAAARSHSFSEFAAAIDTAFARWDHAHLYQFVLADGRRIGQPEFDDFDEGFIDGDSTKLSALGPGEQFVYEFDFGDGWTHLCTVGPTRIDPLDELGISPTAPLPYWGWGSIPDQYGRRWADDDGEGDEPADPGTSDLPPLQPGWGSPG